jgi:ribosomal protein S13
VEIENSKKEYVKKDNMKIVKMMQQTDFKKILEAKAVDINLKIAKLLTNALNWRLDFSSAKGSRFTVVFPVRTQDTSAAGSSLRGENSETKPIVQPRLPALDLENNQTYANNNKISARKLEDEIDEGMNEFSKNQLEDHIMSSR